MDETVNRFKKAQEHSYYRAQKELMEGEKQSHWMWYMFPQLEALGLSENAKYYGIRDLEEAKEYFNDPVLKERLLRLCKILLELPENNPTDIFGFPDDMKLQSSMTLFSLAAPDCEIFSLVLDKFFDGEQDPKTMRLL